MGLTPLLSKGTPSRAGVRRKRGLVRWPTAVSNLLAVAVALLVALGLGAGSARAQGASDLVGSWRSQYAVSGWLGFTLDVTQTGDPARPLRAVGAIGRDRLFVKECARIAPADRWAASTCQTTDKDGPIAFDIQLSPANGAPGFEGVEPRTGATFRFSRAGFTDANVVVDVTQPRADGSREAWSFPPLTVWSGRQPVSPLVGAWIGEVAGTTVEASVARIGDDRVAVAFRYFPDGVGATPGRLLLRLGEVAGKDRPFEMTADLRHMPGRGENAVFAGAVRHLPGEWQIDHGHFASLRLPMNATLELTLARTRDDLISMRTETIVLRPLERGLRDVPPIPSRFAGMSGLWSGTVGPLRVELDIAVSEDDGALQGEIRHFDEAGGAFPPDTPRGFTWAHEVVDKVRPFAAAMTGAGRDGLPTVEGRVATGPQGDLNWFTDFRLGRTSDGTLLLDYSAPNQPVAFPGPPIVLTPLDRDLAPVDVPIAAPASGLAGVWSWRSGETGGNVLLMALEDVDGALEGRLVAQNISGGCETFARTNGLCELARDHGPVNTRIRLEETGDTRFRYAGAHGVRAFGGALPRYSDLRIRVGAGRGPDELLVQMTAADAFGLIPDSTYVFARVPNPSRVSLETGLAFETRVYEAGADDAIGGGACEAWAKEDSLLRQRGDAALTAALDAILAGQTLSVSGHPMDRQCKTMLDAIAALENGGAVVPQPALDPEPIPVPSLEAGGGGLWRGSHFVFAGDMLRRWEQLDALALVDDAFEARVTIEGDGLVVAPPGGEESFADDANGSFRIGTTAAPLARDGRSFAESFDALFDDLKRADMPEASARLRLPYPDGAAPGDHVGADAALWRGRYTFAYLSADETRLFIGHEEAFGVFRYMLLTKVEEAPQPAPQAEAGIAGTWTRVGEPIYVAPGFDVWRTEAAAAGAVDRFELRPSADGYAFVVDATRSTPLVEASFPASAVAPLLAKAAPQTGGSAVSAWLGADPAVYMANGGGGDRLFWGAAADPTSETDVALAIAGERAVAIVGSRQDGGLIDLQTLGIPPRAAIVLLFERSGGGALGPTPSAGTETTPGTSPGGSAAGPTTTADAARGPVCLALDRRTAELNEGGPSTVQIIRAIYADVGLAFGGVETEAKCQRALDQLAGLALIGPHTHAPSETGGDATAVIDQSTTVNQASVVQTVVDTLNAYVGGGGSLDAPGAPDACLALAPIANGLSVTGGIELSGFLGDLFLSVGFSGLETATPVDCYRALAVLGDLGLDPGDADNMGVVVQLIDAYVPARTSVDRPVASPVASPAAGTSRACLAYEAFTGALLERADTPLVQFLRGYAIDDGFGMGSDLAPDAAACSRMLRELVELGLDPALPDAGWSRAAMLLGEGPIDPTPAAIDLRPTGRYDPRPETTREPIAMRPGFGWLVETRGPFGLETLAPGTPVVAFFVPDDAVLGLVAAPEQAHGFCNEGRLLSALDAYRAAASLNLLVRRLGGPPRLVLSGRDCGLAETAAALSAATLGDPAYAAADEYAPADFDRRLDGLGLDDAERALAATAIAGLVGALDVEEPGAWQVLVTTPDIVEAVTGTRPAGGGVVVVDARDGAEIARFRVAHGSERD